MSKNNDIHFAIDSISSAIIEIEEAMFNIDLALNVNEIDHLAKDELISAKELAQSSRDMCLMILKKVCNK